MDKKKFMFLIMGLGDEMNKMPQEEVEAHMGKWFAWDQQLQESGVKLDGEALQPEAKLISGKDKNVTDGVASADNHMLAVGGYYVISAANMDEAVEIAKGCPTFELDGVIEVREVMVMEQ